MAEVRLIFALHFSTARCGSYTFPRTVTQRANSTLPSPCCCSAYVRGLRPLFTYLCLQIARVRFDLQEIPSLKRSHAASQLSLCFFDPTSSFFAVSTVFWYRRCTAIRFCKPMSRTKTPSPTRRDTPLFFDTSDRSRFHSSPSVCACVYIIHTHTRDVTVDIHTPIHSPTPSARAPSAAPTCRVLARSTACSSSTRRRRSWTSLRL